MQEELTKSLLPKSWLLDDIAIRPAEGELTVLQELQSDFVTLLPHYAVLGIQGPDAATFLQGQLSCDVLALSPTQSCRGVHSTPKGRAIASFQLLRHSEEQFYFVLPRSTAALLQQSLAKYIVFSKAELTDHSGEWSILAMSGAAAAAVLADNFGARVEAPRDLASLGSGYCVRLEGSPERFLVVLPNSELTEFWQLANRSLAPAPSAIHLLQDIRAGVATIEAATSEVFIPQMLNYDKLGAISFNKGCYTGQEVIARAHYRGAVKRRLRGLQLASAYCPNAGQEVSHAGKVCGQVVNAVQSGQQTVEGLVVVPEDFDGKLELTGSDVPASTLSLHYAQSE